MTLHPRTVSLPPALLLLTRSACAVALVGGL
ncbi:MAG: hypothetical protein JWO60_775, partial [Frankiales bacterium]|nr:hypothetical protein [Frankiales bacterium]